VGVVVNFGTAWLFMGDRRDLNVRGAFLHMAADGLVSVGVVIAGALTLWQGWDWIDPLASLAVAAVVVLGTWSLFTRSTHLLFDGVPDELSLVKIRQCVARGAGGAGPRLRHSPRDAAAGVRRVRRALPPCRTAILKATDRATVVGHQAIACFRLSSDQPPTDSKDADFEETMGHGRDPCTGAGFGRRCHSLVAQRRGA